MSATWPKVKLGEVLKPVSRKERVDPAGTYRLVGVRLEGRGAFLRETILGSQTAANKLYRVNNGDFIYSRLFACRGAFGIIGDALNGCYVSGEFPTFLPMPDQLDIRYLLYWFRLPTVLARVDEDCTGSTPLTRNRFKEKFFLELEIPLPPLSEQQRIVARIEKLAAQINEARALHQQTIEELDALLDSKILKLFAEGSSKGWAICRLGDYVLDDCYGTSEKTSDDKTGVPILRMGNIQKGQFDLRDLKYLYLSEKERPKLMLQRGDILVNRTNSAELVGKCAVFDIDGDFSFASYLIRLRLDKHRVNPWLIAAYINSSLGRAYMLSEKRQMTGQANVNAKKLKAIPISLPPLVEQDKIVAELEALQTQLDMLRRLQTNTENELDALLPSVLHEVFNGEL